MDQGGLTQSQVRLVRYGWPLQYTGGRPDEVKGHSRGAGEQLSLQVYLGHANRGRSTSEPLRTKLLISYKQQ